MSAPQSTCLTCWNPGDLDLSSLNEGWPFFSDEYNITVNCPPGYKCLDGIYPRVINIPGGTWNIVIPFPLFPTGPDVPLNPMLPYNPNNGGGGTGRVPLRPIRVNCNHTSRAVITKYVPMNFTRDQILSVVQKMFTQCAAAEADAINKANFNNREIQQTYYYFTNPEVVRWDCCGLIAPNKSSNCDRLDENHYSEVISPRVSIEDGVVIIKPGQVINHSPSLLPSPENLLYSYIGVPAISSYNPKVAMIQQQAMVDANRLVQDAAFGIFLDRVKRSNIKCVFFNEPQTMKADCPAGMTGNGPQSSTVSEKQYFDPESKANANSKAADAAYKQAKALLTCNGTVWNTEQTATAGCPLGYSGSPKTATIPAHTYSDTYTNEAQKGYKQAGVDKLAKDAAFTAAQALLTCVAITPDLHWIIDNYGVCGTVHIHSVDFGNNGIQLLMTSPEAGGTATGVGCNNINLDAHAETGWSNTGASAIPVTLMLEYTGLHNAIWVHALVNGSIAAAVVADLGAGGQPSGILSSGFTLPVGTNTFRLVFSLKNYIVSGALNSSFKISLIY